MVSARANLALGRVRRACEHAESALEVARRQDARIDVIFATLTLSSMLRATGDPAALARLGEVLQIAETGARNLELLLLAERGRAARLDGNEEVGVSLLSRARDRFAALDAVNRAREIALDLDG